MPDLDLDRVDELFEECNLLFEGERTANVMYVVGMIVAHALKIHPDVTRDETLAQLRATVDLEMRVQ